MGYRGILAFNAATDQMQKEAKNVQAISAARAKLAQNQQKLDNDKKLSEAKLKDMELKGQGTALQNQLMQSLMDQQFGQHKKVLEGHEAAIDQQEHETTQNYNQAHSMAANLFETDPNVHNYALSESGHPAAPKMVPGPDGGMIMGNETGQDNNTPEAIGSLFEGLPQEGDYQASLNGQGRPGIGKVNAKDATKFQMERLGQAKSKGIPLLPHEERSLSEYEFKKKYPSYNRGQVLNMARRMVLDEKVDSGSRSASQEEIEGRVPDAEKQLYGESRESKAAPEEQPAPAAKETPSAGKGEKVRVRAPNGNIVYIPAANLDKALKRGAKKI